MDIILLNQNQIDINTIEKKAYKVRALIKNELDEILICHYAGVYMLPGGKIQPNETIEMALFRELKEETGILFTNDVLLNSFTLQYVMEDYIEKGIHKYLETTYYYLEIPSTTKIIPANLSENERKYNFKIEWATVSKIEEILKNNKVNNRRIPYYNKELKIVLDYFIKEK